MCAGQPVDQRRRLAAQAVQDPAFAVGPRFGHRQAVPGQVLHQLQVKGQLVRRQTLEQGQHPFALVGADEVVGVLDTGRDALQGQQPTAAEAMQQVSGLLEAYLGVDGHARVRSFGN